MLLVFPVSCFLDHPCPSMRFQPMCCQPPCPVYKILARPCPSIKTRADLCTWLCRLCMWQNSTWLYRLCVWQSSTWLCTLSAWLCSRPQMQASPKQLLHTSCQGPNQQQPTGRRSRCACASCLWAQRLRLAKLVEHLAFSVDIGGRYYHTACTAVPCLAWRLGCCLAFKRKKVSWGPWQLVCLAYDGIEGNRAPMKALTNACSLACACMVACICGVEAQNQVTSLIPLF